MSLFEALGVGGSHLTNRLQTLYEKFFGAPSGGYPISSDTETSSSQFNGNVIGNNAAVLLTDDAQNVVNFLYINPIEFFNNGRASDIYIDFTYEGITDGDSNEQGSASSRDEVNDDAAGSTDGVSGANQVNDNIIGNNAAVLLTDNAQNTVNFLYVNPIQFFNNGRAGDIYLNINAEGEPATESEGQVSRLPANDGNEPGRSSFSGNTAELNEPADAFSEGESATNSPGLPFDFLDESGFADTFGFVEDGFLNKLGFQEPLSLLDALGYPDPSDFDNVADDIVDTLTEGLGSENEINDNVIGNNAAILLTDNAQNTVNFLYINPIEFFNNGSSERHLSQLRYGWRNSHRIRKANGSFSGKQ